jgi:signal transduction histidine kinase
LTGRSDEPALFLDADAYIRDFNQAAMAIFPELQGSTGVSLASVNQGLAEHLESGEAIPVSRADETRFYDVSGTPFISGEIETGRVVTVTDVTERERYRQQLETKSEQLEALNRVIRHDIRNDRMVVRAWSEELQDYIDEEGQAALDRVLRKSRHVIELTDIARDVVESLTAEEPAELEPVALREVLQSELATVPDSHPTATYRVSGEIPAVSVQAIEMLSSVFRNLFENAVQPNDESSPEITVSCIEDDETVRVRIADNGPGIPDGQKEAVFRKDKKGFGSTRTGIGLYLVHTLTEQYGGRVWVEDNDPNGAVCVVELRKSG